MADFISTHVLDTARGVPAADLKLRLYRCMSHMNDDTEEDYEWDYIMEITTNNDGRGRFDFDITAGVYKLIFYTTSYFRKNGTPNFYPRVEIIFRLSDPTSHYHVPLLISPYGYSTYRGS